MQAMAAEKTVRKTCPCFLPMKNSHLVEDFDWGLDNYIHVVPVINKFKLYKEYLHIEMHTTIELTALNRTTVSTTERNIKQNIYGLVV